VEWLPLAARIRAARSIVLGTHINADGDGLGSQIALDLFLQQVGRSSRIVNSEPVPDKYRFLKGSERVRAYDPAIDAAAIRNADLFITIDNSSVERLERVRTDVEATTALKACIDHHSMVNPFWDLNCVDTDACASGQLVYELIRSMGGRVTPEMAEALYVSYVTDTGHFRFPKTGPGAHREVAELMEIAGIDPARIHSEIYERSSPAMSTLTGLALSSMRLEYGGAFAWMHLTRDQVATCRGEEEDTGDLVNLALAIEGVRAGALFREMPDGKIKVSLRSKGSLDVHAIASSLNGGGHRNASGILMATGLGEAIRTVVSGFRGLLAGNGRGSPARPGTPG
jgi:phosphoesterase RecJ-like protein